MRRDFSGEQDCQATLANWRDRPFSQWAFHHVREVLPTANISACRDRHWQLPSAAVDVRPIAFDGPCGAEWTIDDWLGKTATDGICVLRRGRRVFEWYNGGHGPGDPHIVFSVSKSITALLAGILADQGVLDPDAPVTRYIREAEACAYGSCTVRHVLDMVVSVDFNEDYINSDELYLKYRESTGWNPLTGVEHQPDLRSFLLTLKASNARHGAAFRYLSPNSDMLGWIIERAAGQPFAEILSRLLWQPMGAEHDGYITVDRLGAPRTAGGICITLRDMARLGEMMRCRGLAEGVQVIPGWWIDDIVANGDRAAWAAGDLHRLFPGGNYRSKWYMTGTGALCAIGIHGQWIYVDSAREVVIAKQSSAHLPTDDPTDLATVRAFEAICEKLAR